MLFCWAYVCFTTHTNTWSVITLMNQSHMKDMLLQLLVDSFYNCFFQENMASDSNSHSFSSSSVMTYSKMGNEAPKVFQASSQTRCAPGGVSTALNHSQTPKHTCWATLGSHLWCFQLKETRKSLKDSESGQEKMSIGHHIQDRGHVIERKENRKTGEKELNQDFQNMDESEDWFKESFSGEVNM